MKTNGNEISNSNSNSNFELNKIGMISRGKGFCDSKEINSKTNNKNILKNKSKIIFVNDEELNALPYEDAKKYDKRNYFQFYFSLLKTKNAILFTFIHNNDYNSKYIKINLLLFSFILYFTINGLFFNESIIHKIYKDGGRYNFIYQIPLTIYSSLICLIINSLLKFLSLSQRNILAIKYLDNNENLEHNANKIIKRLKIKFIFYFILTFLISIFCCYYLGCFCAVYKNT